MPTETDDTSTDARASIALGRRELVRGGVAALTGLALAAPLFAAPVPARWDDEFDVIVLGGGVAGTCAMVEAARAGASVLLIDSGGAAAEASHGISFYMGGGTALQKAHGFDDSADNMLRYLLAVAGPAPDEERIRVYVERSVANFDWLAQLGAPFALEPGRGSLIYTGSERTYPAREQARPVPRGHVPLVPGIEGGIRGGGAWLQRRLLQIGREQGVRMQLNAAARALIRGADGVLAGVSVELDGSLRQVRARRGVIVATGGFAFNRTMVAEHAPQYLDCTPVDLGWNQGWGIRAGQAVGAAVRRMGAGSVTWPLYPPLSRKQGVLINARGQRFVAEDAYNGQIGDHIVREQKGRAYLLVDSQILADGPGRFDDVIAAQAPTIAALEQALGLPAPVLQQTIGFYNDAARTGRDPLFNKAAEHLRALDRPPFAAIDASLNSGAMLAFFTLGGLHTSVRAEVLDTEGAVIPQFYAVGRASSGIPAPFYYSSGVSLGECVTFGRIAGQQVMA